MHIYTQVRFGLWNFVLVIDVYSRICPNPPAKVCFHVKLTSEFHHLDLTKSFKTSHHTMLRSQYEKVLLLQHEVFDFINSFFFLEHITGLSLNLCLLQNPNKCLNSFTVSNMYWSTNSILAAQIFMEYLGFTTIYAEHRGHTYVK